MLAPEREGPYNALRELCRIVQINPMQLTELRPFFQPHSGDTADADESSLIEQASQDPSAFALLYRRYLDGIYAYIYRRVGNAQEAEDLTSHTFARALDRLSTYQHRGAPFSAWLYRIAHNLVANWHRDERQVTALEEVELAEDADGNPEAVAVRNEVAAALWAAIERLPAERRELIRGKIAELSNLEIGSLLNRSESAIKSLYFRTLDTLRRDLEARGWGAAGPGRSQAEE